MALNTRKQGGALTTFNPPIFISSSLSFTPFLKSYFVRFILISTFLGIFYLLCQQFLEFDFFHALLSKVGFSLGGRALSFALRGLVGLLSRACLDCRLYFTSAAHIPKPYDACRRGDIRL